MTTRYYIRLPDPAIALPAATDPTLTGTEVTLRAQPMRR